MGPAAGDEPVRGRLTKIGPVTAGQQARQEGPAQVPGRTRVRRLRSGQPRLQPYPPTMATGAVRPLPVVSAAGTCRTPGPSGCVTV